MKFFLLAALSIMLIMPLTSCSMQKGRSSRQIDSAAETESNEAAVKIAAPSREAVFVYGQQKSDLQHRVTLNVGGEPDLLPAGYLQLVGVVAGDRPIACLELAGRGLALGEGEKIDAYRIVRIDSGHVVLERR